ncbi:MAG: carboxypeptidase-like regulatory domain-containing protein, partial [Firmicutes bacterium]|nr:carboxypeptidase-like regulatory domain-containing protein [Bacillota bacterium]
MRFILPALIATSLSFALSAQTTGTFSGRITDSKGNPVPTAKVLVTKVGVNWVKELKVGSDGKFLQVGLEPKEYDITITASGYAEIKEREKVPLGVILKKDYV